MTTSTTKQATPIDRAGTKRLMAAVLNDALAVIEQRGGRERRKVMRETEDWFASDDVTWPFSFRNVCAVLGVDPFAVRRVVRRHLDGRPHALAA
jgi:hypothetical protein